MTIPFTPAQRDAARIALTDAGLILAPEADRLIIIGRKVGDAIQDTIPATEWMGLTKGDQPVMRTVACDPAGNWRPFNGVGFTDGPTKPPAKLPAKLALTYHTDAGHGWLGVPLRVFNALGLTLSRYSYRGPAEIFAEEDCDMPKVLAALQARGVEVQVTDRIHNGDCFIRALPRLEAVS
jgi:hypothetical protein